MHFAPQPTAKTEDCFFNCCISTGKQNFLKDGITVKDVRITLRRMSDGRRGKKKGGGGRIFCFSAKCCSRCAQVGFKVDIIPTGGVYYQWKQTKRVTSSI